MNISHSAQVQKGVGESLLGDANEQFNMANKDNKQYFQSGTLGLLFNAIALGVVFSCNNMLQ